MVLYKYYSGNLSLFENATITISGGMGKNGALSIKVSEVFMPFFLKKTQQTAVQDSMFLGMFLTVFCSYFNFYSKYQDGEKNNKPLYRNVGNDNLFLAFTNATDYPLPWTMWGGPGYSPGTHVGNIKFGPKTIACPDAYKVGANMNMPHPITCGKF